jgi:hypothetical protein
MEKTPCTDRVRTDEVLYSVKEERNILGAINWRKADCIGHILRINCVLKHDTEGKIEGKGSEEEKEGVSRY